ncbi:MAG TPA: FHA domain-containing protein [Pyrinomonadaceae bacterium]|nr:FHA domain-containing protein [Pyrinomonadaceae bacterium]
MRIVVAEERNGQPQAERAFDSRTIKIGRDSSECEIVFGSDEWPMVSRRHAELRLETSRCLLVDLNSRYGTFLDGRQLTAPAEVRAGSRVQLGPNGPVLSIRRIEAVAQPVDAVPTMGGAPARKTLGPEPRQPSPPVFREQPIPAPPRAPQGYNAPVAAFLELAGETTGDLRRLHLDRDFIRIGRDLDVDVRIAAAAAIVSRQHAVIARRGDRFELIDQNSFNGTLHNGQRISTPTLLSDGDRIQLGMGGPILRFRDPAHPQPQAQGPRPETIVVSPSSSSPLAQHGAAAGLPQAVLAQYPFKGPVPLTIGRGVDNDIRLDGLQISNHHARVTEQQGNIFIEDTGSTNGIWVNGARISGKIPVRANDTVQIGPFLLIIDPARGVAVMDTRSKTRIDAIDITKIVVNRSGGGTIKLLDDVDLTIQANEFVGLLGPSGAGKSTLMDSLNGMRPATEGQVLINSQDLYQHLDALKQSIGYVPQDDIIHRELTVYRTLHYVARLRLSRDVSPQEMDQIVNEVMDVTGLSERRDVPVGQLSGGQRKRVSIAVELITKPSIIFLDEPTSGLDPATEEKIMKLFRQIAESGRTVILTTHAMENVKLFDKIVVLMRGKLVFYGAPQEALAHVGAESFKDLYDKLEAPIETRLARLQPLPPGASAEQKRQVKFQKESVAEEVAEEWKQRFMQTTQYQRNILEPLGALKHQPQPAAPARRHATVTDSLRQWRTLAQRYFEVLVHDKFNLLILFGQAPIVAFLTWLVVDHDAPRDFPYFVLALVAVWFGTSIAAREIIRERAVYNRERMVNLGLLPYVGSKLFILSLIVGLQCILLFGSLRFFHVTGIMEMPGDYFGIPQLMVMVLTGIVGISVGLFVSAIVKTSEMATSFVPLLLIPQILFCGLVGVPKGIGRYVGAVMPATWSFDEMKRLSSELGVLRGKDEDAMPSELAEGRGLYKHIKHQNDELIDKKQREVEEYKRNSEAKFDDFEEEMADYQKRLQTWNMGGRQGAEPKKPQRPTLDPVPPKVKVVELPDDLSGYVDFMHAWGNKWLNPFVLLLMFFAMTVGTVIALRSQDIG